jgi:hypothetical protein
MSDPFARAKQYRKRAHECLTLAELAPDVPTEAALIAIAQDYLKLAAIEMSARRQGSVQLGPITPDCG